MPTASEIHIRAAVRVLDRERVVVLGDFGYDPELGHHESVAQGALGVTRNLETCVTLLACRIQQNLRDALTIDRRAWAKARRVNW